MLRNDQSREGRYDPVRELGLIDVTVTLSPES